MKKFNELYGDDEEYIDDENAKAKALWYVHIDIGAVVTMKYSREDGQERCSGRP